MANSSLMLAFDRQLAKLGFEVCGDMEVEAANSSLYFALASETNTPVVIKELFTPNNAARMVALEEAGTMAALQHKHIVSLHAMIDFHQRILLVMQLGQRGDLFELIQNAANGRLSVSESKRLFVQLILALEHMHKSGFLHLDIKPDNIFLDTDGNVLLGDFGLSVRRPRSSKMVARGGTLHYSAPETFLGSRVWGPELDVWSAGVVLYVMMRGCYPFWADSDAGIAHSISFQDPDFPAYLPADAVDLMKRMLSKNPAQRITISQLKRHEFVRAEFVAEGASSLSSSCSSSSSAGSVEMSPTMETASELCRTKAEGN